MQSSDGQFDKYLTQVGKEINARVTTTEGNRAKTAKAWLDMTKARKKSGEAKTPEGLDKLQNDAHTNDRELRTTNAVIGDMSLAEYGKLKGADGVSGDAIARAKSNEPIQLIKE